MKKGLIFGLALMAACAAWSAAPRFDRVPDAAQKALKGTKGKKFTAGFAFVNGHYLKPPYTVARYGTAIYINDVQITDQVVPWRQFLATQGGGVSAAPAVKPAASAKPVDDLFDDAPPPPKPGEQKTADPEPEPNGPFLPNADSDRLLKKINALRTSVHRALRENGICFWGKNYARVKVPPRLAKALLAELPEAIRDANDGADLANRLRAKGFAFMHKELCADLMENRQDYLLLVERRKKLREEAELQNMINGSAR